MGVATLTEERCKVVTNSSWRDQVDIMKSDMFTETQDIVMISPPKTGPADHEDGHAGRKAGNVRP